MTLNQTKQEELEQHINELCKYNEELHLVIVRQCLKILTLEIQIEGGNY